MGVNTFFFAFYFFIVVAVHILHVVLVEPLSSLQTDLAVGVCVLQSFMETLLLMGLAWIIQTRAPKVLGLYVGGVFFLLLSHLIDLPLMRLVNMSFWYAIQFLFLESYDNLIELLIASNIPMTLWALIGVSLVVPPLAAIWFYQVTGRLSKKCAVQLQGLHICRLLGWGSLLLGIGALCIRFSNESIVGALPWKHGLFCKAPTYLTFDPSCKEKPLPEISVPLVLEHKPDIYLIIIESLRRDCVTSEITPYLADFQKKSLVFPLSLSNANFTHGAWFSLFHSAFPSEWHSQVEQEYAQGSLPLRLLRDRGYTLHVFSSPRLSYYKMDHIIFGKDKKLLDTLFIPDEACVEPYLRDERAMEKLLLQAQEEGSGRLFILFLDAPHFDYSWPPERSPFTPFTPQVNFLRLALTQTSIAPLMNRYKNALYSTDRLLGTLFSQLAATAQGRESVVVVTGDHGEEFCEQGHLFHTSALSQEQLEVPILYHFGSQGTSLSAASTQMTCHMDIFPSLLHYLTLEEPVSARLQGESIFAARRRPFTISARFHASQTPVEYCIHNGSYKLLCALETLSSKRLKVLGYKTRQDDPIEYDLELLREEFSPALDALCGSH